MLFKIFDDCKRFFLLNIFSESIAEISLLFQRDTAVLSTLYVDFWCFGIYVSVKQIFDGAFLNFFNNISENRFKHSVFMQGRWNIHT